MVVFFYRAYLQQMDEPVSATPIDWMWKWGLICFAAAWAWSLVTSISLWRQAVADDAGGRRSAPPRLADLPKKKSE